MESYNARRQRLVSVFEDTMQKIENSALLRKAVNESVQSQQFIAEKEIIQLPQARYAVPAHVLVTKNRSFEAAAKYVADGNSWYAGSLPQRELIRRVAVLNFASASNPGGGVRTGASAQEECLCRVSTLYPCLYDKQMWHSFYAPHRAAHNTLHNDDIIYTKDVVVLKDDDYNDFASPFKVDVITCAAPNLRESPSNPYNPSDGSVSLMLSDNQLLKIHEQRGRKILSAAAREGADVVILGAFGCGAFRNDPQIVARAYKNILPEFAKYFQTIEFAVYCRPQDDSNYRAFKEQFS